MTGAQSAQLVAARIAAAAPTAKVYNMLGDAVTDTSFASRYVNSAGKLFAFEVTREESAGNDGGTTNAVSRTDLIVAYGYMGYQDGISEPFFQAAIDAIVAAFDSPTSANRTFNGACDWSGPMNVQGPKMGKLGSVLCHYVRITYPITTFPIL